MKRITIVCCLMMILLGACLISSASADSLVLPSALMEIEDEVFYNDTSIDKVILPDGLEIIGRKAFAGSSITRIYLPDSITSIADNAFEGCTGLVGFGPDHTVASDFFDNKAYLTFEREATSVEFFTFEAIDSETCRITEYTGNDSTVIVPSEDTAGLIVTVIGNGAFLGKDVEMISIPESIRIIAENAFSDCTSLKKVILPEGLKTIGFNAFSGCAALESIHIPDSVESLSGAAFFDCSNLKNVNYPVSWKDTNDCTESPFVNCDALEKFTIPEGVSMIPDYAFCDAISINEISLPDSVVSIGQCAFAGTNIEEITIPEEVSTISLNTFWNCVSLKNVSLPEGLKRIEGQAFSNCSSLESIHIPDSVEILTGGAFEFCSNLVNVNYPINWKDSSDSYVSPFANCDALKRITVPSGVTAIPDYAFYDAVSLEEVVLPDSLTSIGVQSFSITGIKSITIPAGVTIIPHSAFKDCVSLKNIILPEALKTIEAEAFSDCSSLERIYIPDSVVKLSGLAFSDCLCLAMVNCPLNWSTIGEYECSPFFNCDVLENVIIPAGVTVIPDYAFDKCTSLKTVYYGGTEEDWSSINIGDYNDPLLTAMIILDHNYNPGNTYKNDISFTMSTEETAPGLLSSVSTGIPVIFTIEAEGYEKIRLFVDGVYYDGDETSVDADGSAILIRSFTKEGNRNIALYGYVNEQIVGISECVHLSVTAEHGKLQAPTVTSIPYVSRIGQTLTVGWKDDQQTDYIHYAAYLYLDDGTYISGEINGCTATWTETSGVSTGKHAIEIIATAPGYTQSSGYCKADFRKDYSPPVGLKWPQAERVTTYDQVTPLEADGFVNYVDEVEILDEEDDYYYIRMRLYDGTYDNRYVRKDKLGLSPYYPDMKFISNPSYKVEENQAIVSFKTNSTAVNAGVRLGTTEIECEVSRQLDYYQENATFTVIFEPDNIPVTYTIWIADKDGTELSYSLKYSPETYPIKLISATGITSSAVRLKWESWSDPYRAEIYRSTEATADYNQYTYIDSVEVKNSVDNTSQYLDLQAIEGCTNYYYIKNSYNDEYSNLVYAFPMQQPTNLAAFHTGDEKIYLSWDGDATGEQRYQVLFTYDIDSGFSEYCEVNSNHIKLEEPFEEGAVCYFSVRAVKTLDGLLSYSENSNTASVRIKPEGVFRSLIIQQEHFYGQAEDLTNYLSTNRDLFYEVFDSWTPEGLPECDENPRRILGGSNKDVSFSDVEREIQNLAAVTKNEDISLIFIGTHGMNCLVDTEYSGALQFVQKNSKYPEFISFSKLASCASQINGRVIIVLGSCGSGSAVADTALRAFAEKNQNIELPAGASSPDSEGVIGTLRLPKFYVIATAEASKMGVGKDSANVLVRWIHDGILTGEADDTSDGIINLYELQYYLNRKGHSTTFTVDGVETNMLPQLYPENSNFQVFRQIGK